MMILCVSIVTIFLPKQARFRFEYEKGKTWMQKDLYSPYNFAIQKTSEEIEEDKDEVLNSVLPVYQYDSEISANAIESFNSEFESNEDVASSNNRISGFL
jgi:membrane-associated HD superfamily phosphohydrolase